MQVFIHYLENNTEYNIIENILKKYEKFIKLCKNYIIN